MFSIKNGNITVSQGETPVLIVTPAGGYSFDQGDTVKLTVKKKVTDAEAVISKTVTTFSYGKAAIEFTTTDTNIDAGNYVYDIQVMLSSGLIAIPHAGIFKVEASITR